MHRPDPNPDPSPDPNPNEVCTAQYFVWYHALLPLVLPSSALLLRPHRTATACCGAAWLASLALWLGLAHQLEFRGRRGTL